MLAPPVPRAIGPSVKAGIDGALMQLKRPLAGSPIMLLTPQLLRSRPRDLQRLRTAGGFDEAHKGSTKDRSARTGRVERTDTRHEDAEYWQSRAERTRSQSRRYKQPAVRDHFVKIAAGYDELARRTRELDFEAEEDLQTDAQQAAPADTPDKSSSRSDQDRVSDALEDDEVRRFCG